jgi:hypothetical protein
MVPTLSIFGLLFGPKSPINGRTVRILINDGTLGQIEKIFKILGLTKE